MKFRNIGGVHRPVLSERGKGIPSAAAAATRNKSKQKKCSKQTFQTIENHD